MMDFNHKRAASDMAYTHSAARNNRCLGPVPRTAFSARLAVPTQGSTRTASFDNFGAKNRLSADSASSSSSHLRSQSCEGVYTLDAPSNGSSSNAAKSSGTKPYDGLITPEDFPQPNLNGFRRGSESSTNSSVSTATTTVESVSPWSAAHTPETMSPASPNGSRSSLMMSPPERISSKIGIVLNVTEPVSPPAKTTPAAQGNMPTPTRPSRARAASHSAPKGFQNTPIESPVPEEEEAAQTMRNSRMQRSRASQESNVQPNDDNVSSLHMRRQQRQQKLAGKAQVKQPVRLRLTPLPSPPVDMQYGVAPSVRTPTSHSPRTLKPSRSMPQIHDHSGPPPAGPLPPVPSLPRTSQQYGASMPPTPNSTSFEAHPPRPSMPPPPPPHSPALSSFGGARPTTSSGAYPHQQAGKTDKSASWEEELRRHKKLLEQFPEPASLAQDMAPKLNRGHRSLGNLRTRSRSLSRVAANANGSEDQPSVAVAGESRVPQTYSSFSLRGPKTQRPSTSKSNKEFRLTDQPMPPMPAMPLQYNPGASFFEDDSDDEEEGGDAVRKFMHKLFSRRTRSHIDMQSSGREGKSSVSSASSKESSAHSHNDRKKNHSASSNLSMATTVGDSACPSGVNSLAPNTPEAAALEFCESLHPAKNIDFHAGPSPRTSAENISSQPAPVPQKEAKAPLAPLLARMFVRRSH